MNFLKAVFLSAALVPAFAAANHLAILSPEFTYPSDPIAVWGGRPVSVEIRSTEILETPAMYLISGTLVAPVSMKLLDLQLIDTETSLKHYNLSFECHEFRDQQAYLLKFPGQGLSLHIEVYPWYYVDRLRDELGQYQLKLSVDEDSLEQFFSALQIPRKGRLASPSPKLQIKEAEYSLLEHKDKGLSIWHTKTSGLQAYNPHSVLRFLEILKLSHTNH